jgi:hypothetical protein
MPFLWTLCLIYIIMKTRVACQNQTFETPSTWPSVISNWAQRGLSLSLLLVSLDWACSPDVENCIKDVAHGREL